MEIAVQTRILAGLTFAMVSAKDNAERSGVRLDPFDNTRLDNGKTSNGITLTEFSAIEEQLAEQMVEIFTLAGLAGLNLPSAVTKLLLHEEAKARLIKS